MNLKELENKTILMFGKSRAFSDSEFESQMKLHKINIVHEYSDKVFLAVDGKMMTPYELNESTKLYEQKKVKSIDINILDKALSKLVDKDTLLESLKLSQNRSKLKDYLLDAKTTDEFFLKAIRLYSWDGEDFFANDSNRDVSAALISRFYKNIDINHKVKYLSRGFLHLILHATDEKLIETIALLEPLKKSFKTDSEDSNYKIISAIATHYATPKNILTMLIKHSNSYVRTLIAMRDDCDEFMQRNLFETNDKDVLEALSYNANLDIGLAIKLMKNRVYEKNIAKYINLNNRVFGILYKSFSLDLATNDSISHDMQKKLIATNNIDIMVALAANKHLHKDIFAELIAKKNEDISMAMYTNSALSKKTLINAYKQKKYHLSLSKNENTPEDILQKLSSSEDLAVLLGLLNNPSTPANLLSKLQSDARLTKASKS